MQATEQLALIIPALNDVVDNIGVDQLSAPTPCARFAVRDILDHMMGGAAAFAPALRGTPATAPTPAAAEHVPTAAAYRAAMDDLLDAANSPGAGERTISAPFGDVPGDFFLRFVAFDGLVHLWDLSTSTGQAFTMSDDLVGAVDAYAREAIGPDLRDGETFANPTVAPEGATAIERLAAFSGRTI